jgi:hypothetical protein
MPNPYDLGPEGLRLISEAICKEPKQREPRCAYPDCDVSGDWELLICDSCGAETCSEHRRTISGLFLCVACSEKERVAKAAAYAKILETLNPNDYIEDVASRLYDIVNQMEEWEIQ